MPNNCHARERLVKRTSRLARSVRSSVAFGVVLAGLFAAAAPGYAQRNAWQDSRFPYRRSVELPADAPQPEVVVADFFTHGQLSPDGGNLGVFGRKDAVPFRVLQVGPGDYCRIAFQTAERVPTYHVYYGGEVGAADVTRPQWTATEGLILETRRWQRCDLNQLESLQKAFAASPRLGADYLARVFHRHNPFDVEPGPFLSRYVGRLNVPIAGKLTFFTSSQDASFLLIDGKLVVAAPGRHPPVSEAKIKGEIVLESGPHLFEYWHAASGPETCMVAAWQLPGLDKPAQISPEMFGGDKVAHLPAGNLEHQTERYLPDFRMAALGDVPADEEGQPMMIRVQFGDATARAITANARYAWDFADGQGSQDANPAHVFLHPGLYPVRMTLRRGTTESTIVHRVQVAPSIVVEKEKDPDKLASYLAMLEQYNAQNLDPMGLVQLVRAYVRVEEWEQAVRLGRMAFTPEAVKHVDQSRWDLIRILGPIQRHQLLDGPGAAEVHRSAAALIQNPEWRAACAIEAADAYLNDALNPAEAKPLLVFAQDRAAQLPPRVISRLHRILGDSNARLGDGKTARAEYAKAAAVFDLPYTAVQATAWQGAYSRSSEAFLREGELRRMRDELDRWQSDFPQDKAEGFWSLLMMGYWIGHEKYPQAVAVASDLLTVSPNSPYADRLLYTTALCEGKQGRKPQAAATLQSLIADYPGSPLVGKAQAQLDRLKKGDDLDYDELPTVKPKPVEEAVAR